MSGYAERNKTKGAPEMMPINKANKSAPVAPKCGNKNKNHLPDKKRHRTKLSRQHIAASSSLFLNPDYQSKIDLPPGTTVTGLIMEVASKKNGFHFIINWDDTNLPLGLSSFHLRQKVEKTDATYHLLVEARQHYQDEAKHTCQLITSC